MNEILYKYSAYMYTIDGGFFFSFYFFSNKINFIMVLLCRETNCKIDDIIKMQLRPSAAAKRLFFVLFSLFFD
jgi:hypothetical protein